MTGAMAAAACTSSFFFLCKICMGLAIAIVPPQSFGMQLNCHETLLDAAGCFERPMALTIECACRGGGQMMRGMERGQQPEQ